MIGGVSFSASQRPLLGLEQVAVSAACSDPTNCTFASVESFLIASYQLHFIELNEILEGVAGQLLVRMYDHLDCYESADLEYSIENGGESYQIQMKPFGTCDV